MLEAQIRPDYTPKQLASKPDLTTYDLRVCEQFIQLNSMRGESMSSVRPLSLREFSLFLQFYPVHDTYYFIDLIRSIDRLYLDGIKTCSKT